MKIFVNNVKESWIIDRVRKEFYKNNSDITTKYIKKSDMIWILSPWVWERTPKKYLESKKIICSHYHFDFNNFNEQDFKRLDYFVDEYHVISKNTKKQLLELTDKKITSIPFWINQKNFYYINEKEKLKKSLGFSENDYLIGSFQRDTESYDLKSPKLIKGPDIFLDIVEKISKDNQNLKVVLTGKNRQYLINQFNYKNIKYKYFEMTDIKTINKLYNILDLYIVSSRIEGGPQAILEAALVKAPLISTDVGVASEILSPISIFNPPNFESSTPDIDYAFKKVLNHTIPEGMVDFRKMLLECYES